MISDSEDFSFGNASKKLKILCSKSDEKKKDRYKTLSDSIEIDRIINSVSTSTSTNKISKLSNDIKKDNFFNKRARLEKPDYPSDLSDDSETECFLSIHQSTKRRSKCRKSRRISAIKTISKKPVKVTQINDTTTDKSPLKAVAAKKKTKRKTKRKTKPPQETLSEPLLHTLLTQFTNGIQNSCDTNTRNNLSESIDTVHTLASPERGQSRSLRGRGSSSRGRGSSSRGRGRPQTTPQSTPQYPTYSIGNTEEYVDKSEDIPLFSSKPKILKKEIEEIVISDEDSDDNEEVTVHVHWQNFEVFKFNLRKLQTLKQIFDFFAKKENVTEKRLFFAYNDVVLTCDDSPDSIKYNIGKFIEGGLISQDLINLVKEHTSSKPSGIQIKFQCQYFKRPYELTVQPNDKLSLAMIKCAEHFEKPLYDLKFEFDGEHIIGTSTAKELDLENGDCIDVRIVK